MNTRETELTVNMFPIIVVCGFIFASISVICFFNYKSNVIEQQAETERALKQDKKTTIDFGFGKKDK